MTAVVLDIRRVGGSTGSSRPVERHLELYRFSAPLPRRAAGRWADSSVYRRRRLLAAGVALLAIAAVVILAQLIQAGIGGGPLTTTGAAAGPGMVAAGASEYVVRPGDTLWSIASSLEPGRDVRPLVDRLAKEIGGSELFAGEAIPIPSR